jgi:tetratricopeptide (TPR) repeat protein
MTGERQKNGRTGQMPRPEVLGGAEAVSAKLQESVQLRLCTADPEYAEAYNCKGLVLMETGHLEEAFQCLEKASELAPGNPKFWYSKSLLFRRLNMHEDEAQACLNAIRIDGKYTMAWYGRARALSQLGELEEALLCLEKCIDLEPFNADNGPPGHLRVHAGDL